FAAGHAVDPSMPLMGGAGRGGPASRLCPRHLLPWVWHAPIAAAQPPVAPHRPAGIAPARPNLHAPLARQPDHESLIKWLVVHDGYINLVGRDLADRDRDPSKFGCWPFAVHLHQPIGIGLALIHG